MEGLKWESKPDEESKAALEKGNSFHLMARRYFMGIDIGLTENVKNYDVLVKWMRNFKEFFKNKTGSRLFPGIHIAHEDKWLAA